MINKLIKLMVFSCLIFNQKKVYSNENFGELPKETAIFKFSSDPYSDWKELTRLVSENEGILECIPKDQEVYNWSKLIVIQYIGDENLLRVNLTNCLKKIKEQMVASKRSNELVWNDIQENENDAIYEWILYNSEDKSVLEHVMKK